ncbi:MAG: Fe-S cluster assembly ATPase SufC [Firmicutes bacterium]|nr:Fe-S cluster assembly ATPase SufC [Bacillota bacterium]
MFMLKIDNLCVKVDDRDILNNFNILINDGEVHAIMGPNGTGKSTVSKVIMGSPDYDILSGSIFFNSEDITNLEVDERSRRGIFLSMQNPISIEGVSNSEFLRTALNARNDEAIRLFDFIKTIESNIKDLDIKNDIIHKSINDGSSGGERKKNEVLQMKVLKPSFVILDEVDSGLDVDSLRIVSENINKYKLENPNTSILIITHYPRILEYIEPDYVHMMVGGKIVKTGDKNLAFEIEKTGYNEVVSE